MNLTFKDVCNFLKKSGKEDPQLIKAVDDLLGLVMICSSIPIGPAALILLPLLSVKNELVKTGRNVLGHIIKDKQANYLAREKSMRVAYCLIVFTSFFEALDQWLPDALRQELKLLESEKRDLAEKAVRAASDGKMNTDIEEKTLGLANVEVAFPFPLEHLQELKNKHKDLWDKLAKGFAEFVFHQNFWKQAEKKDRNFLVEGLLDKLPDKVKTYFEAQFFELARRYPDFAVWSNLQSHLGIQESVTALHTYLERYMTLSSEAERRFDVGFWRLREAIICLPELLQSKQAAEITTCLSNHYQARIEDAILDIEERGNETILGLNVPSRQEAFIPQSYKYLRKDNSSIRLESEATWQALPRHEDLGCFLLSYFTSPYSTESPLVLVGHPGSGKSLLTMMLAAKLMVNDFTVIRVPLMEVDADADIISQIEESIKRISGTGESWAKLRAHFKNFPPLVILDGYDELLQASGQILAGYIKDAQRFQQQQREQGWPVRLLVTSRITLIDQAVVPIGSIILRLVEFNERQRDCWVSIWNKSNTQYFQESRLNSFELPDSNDLQAEKVLTLAEQPLLLLMLALYDSHGNQLRNSWSIDRTELYNSLLRQFILRERCKQKGFAERRQKEIDLEGEWEMRRLRVVALGMYNRSKTHVFAEELDEDLNFFQLKREKSTTKGRVLSQAEMLLGSFFFIHKSKAIHRSSKVVEVHESTAFEFLHNTFGEFLIADYLLRTTIQEVKKLRKAEVDEDMGAIRIRMLESPDGMDTSWLAGLAYTPLFTRPAILQMIREWAPKVYQEASLSEEVVVLGLEEMIISQLRRLLHKREMPSIFLKGTSPEGLRISYPELSLLRHLSIFSINLIILRVLCGQAPFVFKDSQIAVENEDERTWDRLINLWRSEFSLEALNGLAAVLVSKRGPSSVELKAKESFHVLQMPKGAVDKLRLIYNVAMALGDTDTARLAYSHLTRLPGSPF